MDAKTQEQGTEIKVIERQDLTKTPQDVKSKKDLPKYWTREHIHNGLDQINNPTHKMLFTTLWFTGLRITEVLRLRKQDLDFEHYTLEALWQKSRKFRYRTVPMHPTLRNMLEIYCANYKSDEYLFHTPGNPKKELSRQRPWQLCQKYFQGNPHMFRHSFAVNWLRNDGDLTILHRILGHSRIQTTMGYLKIVPKDQGKELLKIQF